MESPQKENDQRSASHTRAGGWRGTIEQQYLKIKANAETYPYVWGSYFVVYGGFGLWFGYRWRKLRVIEDKVRDLQGRIRKLVQDE